MNDTPDALGGGEWQLIELIKGVRAASVEPIVACMPGSPLEAALKAAGVEAVPLAQLRSNPPAAASAIKRLCRERKIDIIHTGSFLTNFSGRSAGRSMKLPVVSTYHCEPDSYLLAGSGPRRRLMFLIRSLVERSTSGRTDAFIAVSQAVADKLIAQGAPAAKVTVIHNGIDAAAVRRGAAEGRGGDQAREPEELAVGTMARLDPVKGLDVLIRAAALTAGRGRRIKLTIIGDGPAEGELKKLAVELGVEDKVVFSGYQAQPYAMLSALDVYAVSSHSEGQNLTVLVAMALDVPVVATRVGGIVDMIEDGKSGLLVPPADPEALAAAIERLAGDEGLKKRLVRGGEEVLPRFTVAEMCRRTLAVYQGLF